LSITEVPNSSDIGDIGRHGDRSATKRCAFLHDTVERLGAPRRQHYAGAPSNEGQGGCPPDPARGASNDDRQVTQDWSPPFHVLCSSLTVQWAGCSAVKLCTANDGEALQKHESRGREQARLIPLPVTHTDDRWGAVKPKPISARN